MTDYCEKCGKEMENKGLEYCGIPMYRLKCPACGLEKLVKAFIYDVAQEAKANVY